MNEFKKILTFIFLLLFVLTAYTSTTTNASADDNVILNDVEHPKTVDQFKYELGATDVQDGDISNNIYVIVDNYTGNETTLGDFIVVYGVKDSLGAEASLAITIRNKDIRPPELILEDTNTLNIPQFALLGNHLPNIIAVDGFEGDLTSSIQINGLGSVDTDIIGDYELTYTVTDTSGNTTTEVFIVNVVDINNPVLTGPTSIIKKSNVILDGQFYLKYFTATDDHDGLISNKITVSSDGYTGNASNPGIYQVVISVLDAAGNSTSQTLTIEVRKDMLVQLIIDSYYWVVPNDHRLSDEEFISILQHVEDLPDYTYIFTNVSDNYSNFYQTKDKYQKTFNLLSDTGEDFERTIVLEVVSAKANIVDAPPGFAEANSKIIIGVIATIVIFALLIIGLVQSKK
jgi:hypothetical protein